MVITLKEVIYSLEKPYTMKWKEGGVEKAPHDPRVVALLMIL